MANNPYAPGILHNWAATAAPATGNDISQGYNIGSCWYLPTTHNLYICSVALQGAAVWADTGPIVPVITPQRYTSGSVNLATLFPGAQLFRFEVCSNGGSGGSGAKVTIGQSGSGGGGGGGGVLVDLTLRATDLPGVAFAIANDAIPAGGVGVSVSGAGNPGAIGGTMEIRVSGSPWIRLQGGGGGAGGQVAGGSGAGGSAGIGGSGGAASAGTDGTGGVTGGVAGAVAQPMPGYGSGGGRGINGDVGDTAPYTYSGPPGGGGGGGINSASGDKAGGLGGRSAMTATFTASAAGAAGGGVGGVGKTDLAFGFSTGGSGGGGSLLTDGGAGGAGMGGSGGAGGGASRDGTSGAGGAGGQGYFQITPFYQ